MDNRAYVDEFDQVGCTPLFYALKNNNYGISRVNFAIYLIFQFLLSKKATPWCTYDKRNITRELQDVKLKRLITKAMEIHIIMRNLRSSQKYSYWKRSKLEFSKAGFVR